jgi:hypothetical protein
MCIPLKPDRPNPIDQTRSSFVMITPLRTTQAPMTPTAPIRGSPPPPESPVRTIQLFPGGESDEFDSFDSFSEDDVKQKDKATETGVSDVEALEVLVCSIEDRMDTFHVRLVNLEKGVMANVDTMNRNMMIINIAMFAHLVACLF